MHLYVSNFQELTWRQTENMPGKILYLSLYMCDSLYEVHLNFQLRLYNAKILYHSRFFSYASSLSLSECSSTE